MSNIDTQGPQAAVVETAQSMVAYTICCQAYQRRRDTTKSTSVQGITSWWRARSDGGRKKVLTELPWYPDFLHSLAAGPRGDAEPSFSSDFPAWQRANRLAGPHISHRSCGRGKDAAYFCLLVPVLSEPARSRLSFDPEASRGKSRAMPPRAKYAPDHATCLGPSTSRFRNFHLRAHAAR